MIDLITVDIDQFFISGFNIGYELHVTNTLSFKKLKKNMCLPKEFYNNIHIKYLYLSHIKEIDNGIKNLKIEILCLRKVNKLNLSLLKLDLVYIQILINNIYYLKGFHDEKCDKSFRDFICQFN